ncbi:hypothetical protein ACHAQA_010022 [Verticillium albo-atrum]
MDNHTNDALASPAWFPRTEDDHAVLAVRNLIFDICTQNGGGHGGSAIGMAAIGVALWKHVMRYNPADPEWLDRDRFVPGVEVTTGPLGQGIANAVGLAIASKNLAANFNKPECKLIQSTTWCMTGDGCLMEGVALEAISLAGHLKLDNLVIIYDNNAVTCDGPLNWINTEDINSKMRSQGWEVIDVRDGSYDTDSIVNALRLAKTSIGRPVMINIRTVIGIDTATAGTFKAHHGSIDKPSIVRLKQLAGLDPNSTHLVPQASLDYFRERRTHGIRLQKDWNDLAAQYARLNPEDSVKFYQRLDHSTSQGISFLQSLDSKRFAGTATRDANGEILKTMWKVVPSLCGGGADLVNSNKLNYDESEVFHPSQGYKGRYIRNGIREHAMASIANGMAAFHPGCFLPITATFFMFFLYVRGILTLDHLSALTSLSYASGRSRCPHGCP